VPRTPWRKPADWERKRLWQNSGITDTDFVGVARIPDVLLSQLRNVFGDTDKSTVLQSELHRIRSLAGPLVDYICDRFAYKSEPINHGIAVNLPGLETVTFDPADRKFLGLHLDSWDGQPLERRARSLNRICINIGSKPRYFMFLNLSMTSIARLLAQESQTTLCRPVTSLGPAFMSRFPGYPIVRVRIAPGEAYIAPTDNIIHDASTVDTRRRSVSLHLRGWFTVHEVQDRRIVSSPTHVRAVEDSGETQPDTAPIRE
jgi:hypothetical protein